VHSSPQLRARQTAVPIAQACGMPFLIVPEIDEVDAGDWTGRSFHDLDRDPRWRRWNAERGSARMPNGEGMEDVRRRVFAHLLNVAVSYADKRVAVVTHAEIIRTVILECRGLPVQAFVEVPVDPASVTTVLFGQRRGKIVRENAPVDTLVAA
jgi:broad specificity phosphatase PhoE